MRKNINLSTRPRRLEMFFQLIEEGLIADKPPEQVTEADFDAIDGRLLLEDTAAAEGISVDEMIDGWEAELEAATSYSSLDEFMQMLNSYPASELDK